MAGSVGNRGRGALKADINVTPLVDVVLVLLIIFMVVTPLLTRGKEVQLPLAAAVDKEQESQDALVLTITPDHQLYLESERISEADLKEVLSARMGPGLGREVLIKADSSLSVRDVRPLLSRLKQTGIKQIAFGVVEEKQPR
jgi:biopolymer transport protein TolR